MTYENLASQLKLTRDKAKTKPVCTGELNVANMLDDVIWFIKEQEKQAELGRAVMKAFEEGKELYSGVLYEMGGYAEIASYNLINTKQDLLEWAKEVEL